MKHHEALKQIVQEHIKKANASLAPFEQVKRQQFVFEPWTIEKGEITPKLSLRRKVILKKHEDVYHRIFIHEEV